jgi:hypothetical protein
MPSVACATGPDARRRDADDVVPSSRRGNEEDGPAPPQPGGQARLAADFGVARRRSRTRLQLPPRAWIPTPDRVCGRYRGRRPDLYDLSVEVPQAYSEGMLRTPRCEEHSDGWRIAACSRPRTNDAGKKARAQGPGLEWSTHGTGYSSTTIVTRRFLARPSLVWLSAIGLYSP